MGGAKTEGWMRDHHETQLEVYAEKLFDRVRVQRSDGWLLVHLGLMLLVDREIEGDLDSE